MSLITEKQLAEKLRVSAASLRVLRSRGSKPGGMTLPAYIKIGRGVRYDERDVDAWLAARRVDPSDRGCAA